MSRLGSIGTQYFDDSGKPLAGGKLEFFETGTTTPATTYSDEALSTENANPVILDASGRQPDIFFDGDLKVTLRDSADVLIETRDPVGCCADSGASGVLPSGGTTGQSLVKSSDTSFETEWASVSDINGILAAPTRHRYWRLTVDSLSGAAPIGFNAIDFRAKGAAFVNGQRWSNGVSVNEFVNSLTSIPTSSPPTGTADLLDGTVTDPPASSSARASYASAPVFVADFGDNPQALTSIRLALGTDGDPSVTGLTLAYSDDNSTYTDVGSTTEISAQTPEEWSIDYPFVEQIVVKANDELLDFPNTGGGGGSAWWTYDYTVKTASFNATAGTYYFVDVGNAPVMTLPASPSPGDRVGASVVKNGTIGARGEFLVDLNSLLYLGDAPTGVGGKTALPVDYDTAQDVPRPQKIELVYLDATYGWVPIYNELVITDGT